MKTIPSIVMKPHKHHIIPRYKCKELGIEPDFDDNLVDVPREQHALIHWGYYCKDLSVLLEYCNPPQNIIDMIPLGDNRDMWAAQLLAEGEIEGIDTSGENHPMYGVTGENHPLYGIPRSEETKRKISIANTGKHSQLKGIPRTKEWCEKVSGEGHWTYGMEPGEHPMNGFKHSEETRKKLSIALTGKRVTEETKEKIRIARAKQVFTEEHIKAHADAMVARRGIKLGPMSEETKKKISESKKKFYADNPNICSTWSKRGEEHQSYAHGKLVNARNDPEARRAYKAEWYQKNKDNMTREQKDAINKKKREKRAKNKSETGFAIGYFQAKKKLEKQQGVGTLEKFL